MTSPADGVAGSVEVQNTDANSARSADAHDDSVRTVRAIVIAHRSASSRGSPYHPRPDAQPSKHSHTKTTFQGGAASACATTPDMKKQIALRGNCVATAEDAAIYTSCALTGAILSTTNSCTVKTRRATRSYTVTEKVEVEPTSIQRGG